MKKAIIISLLVYLLSSCKEDEDVQKQYVPIVEINDSVIQNAIKDFVVQENLVSDSVYLTLNYFSLGTREVSYLSYEDTFIEDDEAPIFISRSGSFLVFAYSDLTSYFDLEIPSEIKTEIKSKKIKSEYDFEYLTHPAIWKITKCEGVVTVETQKINIRLDHAPCGYYFDYHENRLIKLD